MTNNKNKTLFLAQFSILLAIEAVFCFTALGSLPAIGQINATLAMLPVIITGMLLGVRAGTCMGFFAGIFSFVVWTFMPPNPAVAFLFTPFYSLTDGFKGGAGSLFICFVPRILVGTVSAALLKILKKKNPDKNLVSYFVSAVAGSLTNTVLVLGGISVFYGAEYSNLNEGKVLFVIIGTTVLFSGIPEAAVSGIICPAVCMPLKKIAKKQENREKQEKQGNKK